MTWHIVCLAGPTDTYIPSIAAEDTLLIVPFDIPDHPDTPQTSVSDIFATYGLSLNKAITDLLHAAIAAYTADVRIPRRATYDGWTRDLVLHLAVLDHTGWESGAARLEDLLAFLTGDHWRVDVRETPRNYRPALGRAHGQKVQLITDTVALFSGGLDSYIGAIDALTPGKQIVLVGHHAAGQGPTSIAQRNTLAVLRVAYPTEQAPFLKCWISPPKGGQRVSETTTRGRSVLFLALGVAVASALGDGQLIVPENGVISLNVPLTPPRLGSFSTRTTHPHLIDLLRSLLNDLGVHITITLPYRFQTKGEMLIGCANQSALAAGLPITMSCAHPGVGRFTGAHHANQHCGYCVPCLIRRAAINIWGVDPTPYTWNDLRMSLSPTRLADLRAFRLALDRYARHPPTLANILTAGPLPGTSSDYAAYLDVFRRGIDEVHQFVDNFAE